MHKVVHSVQSNLSSKPLSSYDNVWRSFDAASFVAFQTRCRQHSACQSFRMLRKGRKIPSLNRTKGCQLVPVFIQRTCCRSFEILHITSCIFCDWWYRSNKFDILLGCSQTHVTKSPRMTYHGSPTRDHCAHVQCGRPGVAQG